MTRIETLKAKYEPKIIQCLGQIRALLWGCNYVCTEVVDLSDDEYYCWGFIVNPDDGKWCEKSIGVDFYITEQEDGPGITFCLKISGDGGRIIGELIPYNHTPEYVVDMFDDEAVETRFQQVAQNCCIGLLEAIQEYEANLTDTK